jgi:glycosyltransferase involved in cell wall biosynthesis
LDLDNFRSADAIAELHLMRRWGIKVYHVIYDLLPLQIPHFFPDDIGWYEPWLQRVCAFDGAICISQTVAEDLHAWVANNRDDDKTLFDISWFHLGADFEASVSSRGLSDEDTEFLEILNHRPTFLMVGTVEPRKGHRLVLAAFEYLWTRGIDANLVIIGKKGWKVADVARSIRKSPEWNTRLFWIENASDVLLEKVYSASTCLIAASEGEGFGLPLVEAAQHKLPIIARDIPIFREVAGEHATYFQGAVASDLSRDIEVWLTLWQKGHHVRSDNMPWLTWEQSVSQLLSAIVAMDK